MFARSVPFLLKTGLILPVFAISILVPKPVRANEPAVKKEIQAQYDRISTAYKTRSSNTLTSILTDDFTDVDPSGKAIDREHYLNDISKSAEVFTTPAVYKVSITSLKVVGNKALVQMRQTLSAGIMDVNGSAGPKGKMHTIGFDGMSRDTWIKQNDTWRLQKIQEVAGEKRMLDGKLIAISPNPNKTKK